MRTYIDIGIILKDKLDSGVFLVGYHKYFEIALLQPVPFLSLKTCIYHIEMELPEQAFDKLLTGSVWLTIYLIIF